MTLLFRLVLTLLLAGALLFCLYGFRAAGEPGDAAIMMAFRVAYGLGALLALGGLAALWRKKPVKKDGPTG